MKATPILRRSLPLLAGAVALMLAGGCGDDVQGPSDEGPDGPSAPSTQVLSVLIVSNPVTSAPAAGASLSFGGISSSKRIVFVSMPPGSVPDGERIVIRVRDSDAEATAAIVGGGFDPVPLAATAGDTLDIRIELSGGEAPVLFYSVVPPSTPPVIVRTDPPPQKRDVPLNAVMLVVFSEPIDAATLTATSVQLSQDGEPTPGNLEFADDTYLQATFSPAEPLNPSAEYTLLFTNAIEDLDGEQLEAVTVKFTTVGPAVDDGPEPMNSAGRLAFVGNAILYVMTSHGVSSILVENRSSIRMPAWSPDGSRIAFMHAEDWETDDTWAIHTVAPDGTGRQQISPDSTQDMFPTWAPDGSRIAFASQVDDPATPWPDYNVEIFVMDADGTNRVRLTNYRQPDSHPVWSPDGMQIAFTSYGETGEAGVYVVNPDGTDRRRLIGGEDDLDAGLIPTSWSRSAWSPEGNHLAYSVAGGIVIIGSDGSDPTLLRLDLPPGSYADVNLTWSPDGEYIAFNDLCGELDVQDCVEYPSIWFLRLADGSLSPVGDGDPFGLDADSKDLFGLDPAWAF